MSAAYNDPYDRPSFLVILNRALSASFRVGNFFGVELRVLWITVILVPLFTIVSMAEWAGLGEILFAVVLYSFGTALVIYSHEMGHVAAGWRYQIHTPLITISPLGGLAHMGAPAPTARIERIIALAGPAVHLVWLALFWPLSLVVVHGTFVPDGWLFDPVYELVRFFVYINFLLMIFNLLPFYPMDGGRVLRSILAGRMHPNRASILAAKIGMGGAVAMGLWGLFHGGLGGGILMALGLRSYFDCRQAQQEAKYSSGPYGGQREAWQMDPDFWKASVAQQQAQQAVQKPLGYFGRRKQKREQERAAKQHEAQQVLDTEVDQVLARVSEVGINGLSVAERDVLNRASKQRRKTGG